MNTTLPFHRAVPAALLELAAGEVHVWVARLDTERDMQQLERYRALLDEQEGRRLDRLATTALKAEFLLTRALCRETLSRYADVAPRDWRFEVNAYGKPAISGPTLSSALGFNLSNARNVVACAVALDADLGIDIEQWSRPDDSLPITAQIFSASELHALRDCDPQARRRLFYELWTLKEAYVKARGQGLSMNLDEITFDPHVTPIRASFSPAPAHEAQAWHFEQIEFGRDHLLALAIGTSGSAEPRITVREVALAKDAPGFVD